MFTPHPTRELLRRAPRCELPSSLGVRAPLLVLCLVALLACGSRETGAGDVTGSRDLVPMDTTEARSEARDEVLVEVAPEDIQELAAEKRIHGWILLDPDPTAMLATIDEAARQGVNHVQLSHGLIMNLSEILGEDEGSLERIETLNLGIARAHEQGMEAWIWSHEFDQGVSIDVCYAPEGAVWAERAEAYRETAALLPGLDGVVMMFGSAPLPPWFTICSCDPCLEDEGTTPLTSPDQGERLRYVVEELGDVIVNELGLELMVRTFVHEPQEIDWHAEGLSAVQGVAFTGMHKGPVQDWQPYNPHHANIGAIGDHPAVVELDVAGEYYGKSWLPWCAPDYYRYRLRHLWANAGIGAVVRVQRGSDQALGTPNEVNIHAIRRFLEDIDAPTDGIWQDFLLERYGLAPGSAASVTLQAVLSDSFPIRRKAHYALGIWALEKGSGFPSDLTLDQFRDRGEMPKWDPDWAPVWEALDRPGLATVLWLWQEGSEAVTLSNEALARFEEVKPALPEELRQDLEARLGHQALSSEAWRALDLVIWGSRALGEGVTDPRLEGWLRWGLQDIERLRSAMVDQGFSGKPAAAPGPLVAFLEKASAVVEEAVTAEAPPGALFSPLRFTNTEAGVEVRFTTGASLDLSLDLGAEIPDYGQTLELPGVEAGVEQLVILEDLAPGRRYVLRLRATHEGLELRGGDFWLFTPGPSGDSP